MKIIFCTKYHCELNAIEGLWCNQKAYIRSRTNQTFDRTIQLISESREHFVKKRIALKLFRRFWRSVEAYSRGLTDGDVLKFFFSELSSASVQSHRKISNAKLDTD